MSFEVLGRLSHEDWAAHLEADFAVRLSGETIWLKLLEVSPRGAGAHPDSVRVPYSLVFQSRPSHYQLGQGTYSFVDSPFGDLEIFLVPIDHSVDGTRLHAAFS